jgi:hypothetical protein
MFCVSVTSASCIFSKLIFTSEVIINYHSLAIKLDGG